MRQSTRFIVVCLATILLAAPVLAAKITGDYVETRSADVYTGPCYANSEGNLTGKNATLAWRIRRGEWNGVTLDGLSVVGVARANATLGDPFTDPYPATAVLIVDGRASAQQKQALIEFAQTMGGRLLENVTAVDCAPISMEVGEGEKHGRVVLKVGNLAGIQTRPISDKDHLCGNEEVYYPPLTNLSHAMPAVSLLDEYHGNHLGMDWRIRDKRNAFVGTFER